MNLIKKIKNKLKRNKIMKVEMIPLIYTDTLIVTFGNENVPRVSKESQYEYIKELKKILPNMKIIGAPYGVSFQALIKLSEVEEK